MTACIAAETSEMSPRYRMSQKIRSLKTLFGALEMHPSPSYMPSRMR
jgi:hypothetical protein